MGKVCTLEEVVTVARAARSRGKRVVATNGCFDLLHLGHARYLRYAKKQGDLLIVGVNSDESVRLNKGPLRPIIPARERAELVAALEAVDYAFIFRGKTTSAWIPKIQPEILVKGADTVRHPDFPAQKALVEKYGGKFALAPLVRGRSTTRSIETILERYRGSGAKRGKRV